MGVDLNDRPAWQMYIGVILMDRFLQEISHINSYVRHKLDIKTGLISPRGENVNTFGSLLKLFTKLQTRGSWATLLTWETIALIKSALWSHINNIQNIWAM